MFYFQIIWADRQVVLKRQKRDYIGGMDEVADYDDYDDSRNKAMKGRRSEQGRWKKMDESNRPRRERTIFNDELWDQEWYLVFGSSSTY